MYNEKMVSKRIKRPRDTLQLAKLIGQIATGQVEDKADDGKNPIAVARGKLGGIKGGKERAKSLSRKRRKEIAKKAAKARWRKKAFKSKSKS